MDNPTPDAKLNPTHSISDEHLGAVEGDRANDTEEGNSNAPALDDQGMPKNDVAIFEDVVGAHNDESQG